MSSPGGAWADDDARVDASGAHAETVPGGCMYFPGGAVIYPLQELCMGGYMTLYFSGGAWADGPDRWAVDCIPKPSPFIRPHNHTMMITRDTMAM